MKKLFLLLTVLCAAVTVQAQVISAYTMQATQGTYTEITDGTAMDTTGIAVDDMQAKVWYPDGVQTEMVTKAGFPIGFEFEYNDIICNQFVIGSDGYVALGRDEITIDPSHSKFIAIREEGADNVVGIMPNVNGQYLLETTEISYKVLGEAPYRTLVVQYKDWGPSFSWDESGVIKMNMQLRFNETTNTIEFVLGEMGYEGSNSKGTRYTLRGNYKDQISLTEGEEEGMINYVAAVGDNSPQLSAGMIPSGLTYTFTPPAECVAPENAMLIIKKTATSNAFSMEWLPLDDADHVLILLAKDFMLTEEPVDGVQYAAGDSLGNAYVLEYTTETVYETPEELVLDPATNYYLHIYPANSNCRRGPVYGRMNAILTDFETKPAAPVSVNVTATTTNTLTFDVEANATNNVMVVLTDSVRLNPPYANEIEFGTPEGELAVGDVLQDMGRVVYMGTSAQNVVVEGLEPGTAYYLRAISYDDKYNYSTLYAENASATVATLPWNVDLTYVNLGDIPAGWESTATNSKWTKTKTSNGYGDDEAQFYMQIVSNTTDGHIADLTTSRILVDKRDALLSLEYCMYVWARFGNSTYDAWDERDKFAIQVSANDGEWKDVTVINSTNNVKVDSVNQFIPVQADLSEYVNQEIRIRIHWECYSGSKVRCPIEDITLDGRPIPVIPEVTVSDVTWNSANVTWRGEQENYEFAYAKTGEEFVAQVVADKSVALTDLTHLTEYQVKVRGIVAEGDTTEWSEVVTFTTADLPVCPIPEGLTHVATEDFGDKLSWTINEEHLSWDLRYREGSSTSWTDIEGLESNEYTLYNLKAGVAYIWRVRAHCDMERVSNYASQETFDANGKSTISAANADRLKVAAGNGSITILNSDVYVESVTLLDVQGRVLGNYTVNARENITIPTNATGVAIVLVNTVDKQLVYKVSVK